MYVSSEFCDLRVFRASKLYCLCRHLRQDKTTLDGIKDRSHRILK